MRRTHETRVTRLTVAPRGDQTYSEMATHVEIVDEAAGEFVKVSQSKASGLAETFIDPSEWPAIRAAINRMIAQCRGAG